MAWLFPFDYENGFLYAVRLEEMGRKVKIFRQSVYRALDSPPE